MAGTDLPQEDIVGGRKDLYTFGRKEGALILLCREVTANTKEKIRSGFFTFDGWVLILDFYLQGFSSSFT
jgi:hypothetical protein